MSFVIKGKSTLDITLPRKIISIIKNPNNSESKHFIPKIKKYHTRVTMYKQKPNRYKYINSAINANPVILHYGIEGVRKKKRNCYAFLCRY